MQCEVRNSIRLNRSLFRSLYIASLSITFRHLS